MKTLFRLKEFPNRAITMLTQERAEEYYSKGKLPFTTFRGSGATWVPCGFYAVHMTFEQWLDAYEIKLL